MSRADDAPATRTKAKAALGALSLLVIGAVLGFAFDRHVLLPREHGAPLTMHGSAPAAMHEALMESVEERLDLTAEQRRQIDAIIAARHDVLRQTWEVLHTQLGAAVDSVHQEVEAVLTPEQRAEFREWLREMGAGG